MTTPNQPVPEWMQIVGLGSWQVGGSGGGDGSEGSFGQNVTSDAVTNIISGPATDLMNLDGVSATSDVVGLLGNYLKTLPLQALQMFKGFLPNTTTADFADVPTAVSTITGAMGLTNVTMTAASFSQWLSTEFADATAAGTAFVTWLQAVSAAVLGYTTWTNLITALDAAWATYQSTIGTIEGEESASFSQMLQAVFGIEPSTGQNAGWAALSGEIADGNAAFATLVTSWWTSLTAGGQSWTAVLAQMDTAWATYLSANSAVNVSESATLSQLIGSLLGINLSNGLTQQANVDGLNESFIELGSALSGDVADAGDWAWLAQLMNQFYTLLGITHTQTVNTANTVAIVDNKPISYGLDSTTESNIAFTAAVNKINVTATATEVTFVRCAQTDTKNTIAFTASTSSAPTGFYVNLYMVDFVNSEIHYINTSANLVSQLTSSEKWIFTTASASPVSPGSVLAIEFQVVGSGSVDVYGQTISGKPTHPTAVLPGAAATRTGTPGVAQSVVGFTGLNTPTGVALDSSGNIYVSDYANSRIVELSSGSQSVLGFSGVSLNYGVAVDSSGAVYMIDTGHSRVLKMAGGVQTVLGFSGLGAAKGIALDSSGAVYVADSPNNRVVKLAGGTQTVLGFTGLSDPWGIAVDGSGNVFVGDNGNSRVVKLAGGTQSTLGFSGLSNAPGVALDAAGNVYVTDTSNNRVVMLSGGTQSVLAFSGLSNPVGVSVDSSGNVYVCDESHNRVVVLSKDASFTALTFNNTSIPYVGLETSSPPPPTYPDVSFTFTSAGSTTTQLIDEWAQNVDLTAVGGGGGGEGEIGISVGRGGSPGVWATKTLVRGVDIPATGVVALTVTVGVGGAGGAYFANGSPGGATTISWVDPSGATQMLTALGGAGGGVGNTSNLTEFGQSPGNQTWPASGVHSQTYVGGAAQNVPGIGYPPGGSGPGGPAFLFGYAAGRGQAWIVERQT